MSSGLGTLFTRVPVFEPLPDPQAAQQVSPYELPQQSAAPSQDRYGVVVPDGGEVVIPMG
jgi:hypothetical protein